MAICEEMRKRARELRALSQQAESAKREQFAEVKKDYTFGEPFPDRKKEAIPKKVGLVYGMFPPEPNLLPDAVDVRKMLDGDSPFICRATKIAGETKAACYTPGAYYEFIKRDRERLLSAMNHFGSVLKKKYGVSKARTPEEIKMFKHLTDEWIYFWSHVKGLAPQILDRCTVL